MDLDSGDWGRLAQACSLPSVCVDLARVDFVQPPGVLALVLAARHRAANGLSPLEIIAPRSADVRTYLGRVDVVDKLEACGCDVSAFEGVRHHRRHASSSFTEVLDGPDGMEEILPVVWSFLNAQLGNDLAHVAYSPLVALVSNVGRHAGSEGAPAPYAAAQVQVYQNRIELAVGDLGRGFLESLSQNPDHAYLGSDEDALRVSIRDGASRYADPRHGGDVARVVDRARKLGGRVQLVSRDGTATATTPAVRYSTAPTRFPGSLIAVRLPRIA